MSIQTVGNDPDRKASHEGTLPYSGRQPLTWRNDAYSLRIQTRVGPMLSFPDPPREIARAWRAKLRTHATTPDKVSALSRVVATAGKRVHVVKRPDNRNGCRNITKKGGITDKVRDPVKMKYVSRKGLAQNVAPVLAAIV